MANCAMADGMVGFAARGHPENPHRNRGRSPVSAARRDLQMATAPDGPIYSDAIGPTRHRDLAAVGDEDFPYGHGGEPYQAVAWRNSPLPLGLFVFPVTG